MLFTILRCWRRGTYTTKLSVLQPPPLPPSNASGILPATWAPATCTQQRTPVGLDLWDNGRRSEVRRIHLSKKSQRRKLHERRETPKRLVMSSSGSSVGSTAAPRRHSKSRRTRNLMAVEHWKWIAGFNSFSQAALVTSPRPGI